MHIPFLATSDELAAAVEELGFLPLMPGALAGFSVYEHTDESAWFTGDRERCPWEWRYVLTLDDRVVYGKFFGGKAGYISRELLPLFANYRRDGYDFDSLYEDGKATRKACRIMACFSDAERLASWQLRQLAGFGRGGEKGFEGALTAVQMQCYLAVCGFERKRSRRGDEYGMPTSIFTRPETRWGEDFVRSAYSQDPQASLEHLCSRLARIAPDASEKELKRFLK